MAYPFWVQVLKSSAVGTFGAFDEAEQVAMLPDEPSQMARIAGAIKGVWWHIFKIKLILIARK